MATLFVRHCQHQGSFMVVASVHQDQGDDTFTTHNRSYELGPFDDWNDLIEVARTGLVELLQAMGDTI